MKEKSGGGRLLKGVAGLALIGIGIPLLVLPGPGLLLIGAGGWTLLRAFGKGPGRAPTTARSAGVSRTRRPAPAKKEAP